MRVKHVIIAVLAVLIVVPAAALAVFVARFDPNEYAPDIIAAVDQATGRQLRLGGPIRLELSLHPRIAVSGVSLSNPPGFADTNLLTLDDLQAQLALLPLLNHKVDILKLILVSPKITLETDASGKAGWDLTPAGPTAAPAGNGGAGGYQVAIESVEIQNGLLVFKGGKTAGTITLAITDLTGQAASPSAPLNLQSQAVYNGTAFTLNGVVGPVERFFGVGSGAWPVALNLATAGATASVQGSIAEPRLAQGYDLTVNASIPALEAMTPVLPPGLLGGMALPPLHGIAATARIVDQNSTIPAIDHLSIKAGASDLGSFRAGLTLRTLDIEMASLDQHITVNAAGEINQAPLGFTGDFGPPQALFNPALLPSTMPPQGSYPVNVQMQDGGAKLAVTGAIATPAKLAGVALAVTGAIPDLSALSVLAGTALPKWRNISFQTTMIDPGGMGLTKAAGLDSLALTMDNAAFGGDASVYFGAQPRLQAAFSGQRIDLDALIAAIPPPAPPPPAQVQTPAVAPAPTPAPVSPPVPAAAAPVYVIPDTRLPLGVLKADTADVQLSADTVIFNKASYSAIQGHAVLANGVLTINPLTAQLPGGSVSATAALDANQEPATASVTINAPALALSPFLRSLNLPDTAQGTMQAALTASGTGDTPHDMASTMNGQLGLALVNGLIDGAVLDKLFGTALRTVGLPEQLVGAHGPVSVRCFGLRVDAANGLGTVKALTLDSSRLQMQGGGTINFGSETLGIVLRPQLQFAGNQVGVPVEIGGTFAAPTTAVAPFGALQEAAKSAVGLPVSLVQGVVGSGGFLGKVVNTLGLGEAGDVCPAALNLGRLGQPGPAAAPPAAPSGGIIAPITSGPKNLLNSLFGN